MNSKNINRIIREEIKKNAEYTKELRNLVYEITAREREIIGENSLNTGKSYRNFRNAVRKAVVAATSGQSYDRKIIKTYDYNLNELTEGSLVCFVRSIEQTEEVYEVLSIWEHWVRMCSVETAGKILDKVWATELICKDDVEASLEKLSAIKAEY